MKKYTKPSIEIIEFTTNDVILVSGNGNLTDGGTGDFTGGGANAGWGQPSSTNILG